MLFGNLPRKIELCNGFSFSRTYIATVTRFVAILPFAGALWLGCVPGANNPFDPENPKGYPLVPRSVSVKPWSAHCVEVNWENQRENRLGTIVEQSFQVPDSFVVIDTLDPMETRFMDSSLTSKTLCYYRLRSYNTYGYSEYTSVDSARTWNIPPVFRIDTAWQGQETLHVEWAVEDPDDSTWNMSLYLRFGVDQSVPIVEAGLVRDTAGVTKWELPSDLLRDTLYRVYGTLKDSDTLVSSIAPVPVFLSSPVTDTVPPRITLIGETSTPHETHSLQLQVEDDVSGVARVTVEYAGKTDSAAKKDSIWEVHLSGLNVGSTRVVVTAYDGSGNADSLPVAIIRSELAKDKAFEHFNVNKPKDGEKFTGQILVILGGEIRDGGGIGGIRVWRGENEYFPTELDSDANTWTSSVRLIENRNVFKMLAWDSAGNYSDTLWLTLYLLNPENPPTINLVSGQIHRDSLSPVVFHVIHAKGVAVVKINDKVVAAGESGKYRADDHDWTVGDNRFKVEATSSNQRDTTQTFIVHYDPPPSVPKLGVGMATASSIELNWDLGSDTDLTRVVIYRYDNNGADTTLVKAESNLTITSHVVTGLAENTQYTFQAFAHDAHSKTPSKKLQAVTANAPPASVVLNPPEVTGAHSVRLSWERSEARDFEGYDVFFDTTKNIQWTLPADTVASSISDTSITLGGLRDTTRYYFKVFVRDAQYKIGSNEVEGLTRNASPAAANVQVAAVDASTIRVTWSRSHEHDFAAYKVYRATASGITGNETPVRTFSAVDDTTTLFDDLQDTTRYFFRVFVHDGSSSHGSDEVSGATLNAAPLPVQLDQPGSGGIETDAVALTWAKSSAHDFKSYKVHYAMDPNVTTADSLGATLDVRTDTSATVQGLRDMTQYYFKVFVTDLALDTGSNEISAITKNAKPPKVVISSQALAVTDSSIRISWEKSQAHDFYRYKVIHWVQGAIGVIDSLVADRNTRALTVNGLPADTIVNFRIRVLDSVSQSMPSHSVSFRTYMQAPCADYDCDTTIIRSLLATNGHDPDDVTKSSVVRTTGSSSNKRVNRLHLAGHPITQVPNHIGRLSRLDTLDLSNSQVTTLPDGFCDLWRLKYLRINKGWIASLPGNFGRLDDLQFLEISQGGAINGLQQFPEEIGQCGSLRVLYLHGNRIPSVPASIGGLSHLTTLVMNHNSVLHSLPDEILSLTKLTYLNLWSNNLSSLPAGLWKVTSLRNLMLPANPLGNVSDSIGDLVNLTSLELGGCSLSTLPATIGQLTQINFLNIMNNQLEDLPSEITQLNPTTLWVKNNSLCNVADENVRNWLTTHYSTWNEEQNCE